MLHAEYTLNVNDSIARKVNPLRLIQSSSQWKSNWSFFSHSASARDKFNYIYIFTMKHCNSYFLGYTCEFIDEWKITTLDIVKIQDTRREKIYHLNLHKHIANKFRKSSSTYIPSRWFRVFVQISGECVVYRMEVGEDSFTSYPRLLSSTIVTYFNVTNTLLRKNKTTRQRFRYKFIRVLSNRDRHGLSLNTFHDGYRVHVSSFH